MYIILSSNPTLEIILAILTVIGSLGGTLLGWLLGKWRKSKISVVIDEINEKDETFHPAGAIIDNGVKKYTLYFRIRLYNSGDINGVMRNLKVKYYHKGLHVLSNKVINAKNFSYFTLTEFEYLDNINVKPNIGEDYYCVIILDEKPVNQLPFLCYVNEKNKEVISKIII